MNCPICGTTLADETTPCPTCGRGAPTGPPQRPGGPVHQVAQDTIDATKRTAKEAARLSRKAAAEVGPMVERATQDAAALSRRAYHEVRPAVAKATQAAADVSKQAIHEVRPTIEKVAHATEGAIHGAVRGAKEGAKRPTSRPPAEEKESPDGPSDST